MYSGNPRVTAYAEYVFSNVNRTLLERGGVYNVKELAELVGLKPTGNFRRRIKQLVKDGQLEAIAAFTPRGGIEARYMLPVAAPELEEAF
jgi:hypothetical protein